MFTTYLNFQGTCAEAFRFYERCFGGRIEFMQTFGESPMKNDVKPEEYGLIMHVALKVDDDTLMGSDAPPGRYQAPQGIYVAVHPKDICGGGTDLQRAVGRRQCRDAVSKDFLVARLRHDARSVRDSLDGELRGGGRR
jgi:uncharacterized glyoxalase superfamily protein PhnB